MRIKLTLDKDTVGKVANSPAIMNKYLNEALVETLAQERILWNIKTLYDVSQIKTKVRNFLIFTDAVNMTDRVKTAQQIILDTINSGMANFYRWVATNFMIELSSTGRQALAESNVIWKPLTERYVERRRLAAAARADGFWEFSGKLIRQFMSSSKTLKRVDALKITDRNIRWQDEKYAFSIDLLPGLRADDKDMLSGRSIESLLEALGNQNAEIVEKLQGRASYYRPLLAPAFKFYIEKVIRKNIINRLQAAGFDASEKDEYL